MLPPRYRFGGMSTTTSTEAGTTTSTQLAVLGEVTEREQELPRTGATIGILLLIAGGLLTAGGGGSWYAHAKNDEDDEA